MTTTRGPVAGTLLAGRYRLVQPLPGRGRWRAHDDLRDRDLVAREVALPDADRDHAWQRVLRDAAAVARQRNPGIVHLVDAIMDDGTAWVLTEVPAGRSLGDVVRRHGPLPPAEVARIGLLVLDALVASGVRHGDLTPDDVILGPEGQVAVTGFAATGVGAGTRGFQAPEGGTGAKADLWALGATLFVAVEGRMPSGTAARAGALEPVLAGLLVADASRRADPEEARRLLEVALVQSEPGAEPAAGPPARAGHPTAPPAAGPARAGHPTAPPAAGPAPAAPPAVGAPRPAPAEPSVAERVEAAPRAAGLPGQGQAAGAESGEVKDPEIAAALAMLQAALAPTPRPGTEPDRTSDGPGHESTPAGSVVDEPAAPADGPGRDTAPGSSAPDGRPPAHPTAARPSPPASPAASTSPSGPPAARPSPPVAPAVRPDPVRAPVTRPGPATPGQVGPPAARPGPTGATPSARPAAADTPTRTAPTDTPARPTPAGAPIRANEGAAPTAVEPDGTATSPDRAAERGDPPDSVPAPPRAGGSRRRLRMVIGAVVLAVLVAVLVPFLLRDRADGDGDGDSVAAPAPTPAAGTSAPRTDTTPSPEAAGLPPAGYELYRDPAGWSVAVPTGWRPQRRGAATTFTDQGRTLKISYRDDPPADPYDDALKLEPVVKAATPGYDLARIAAVTYRGWPTADWEYRAGTTTKTHTLTRTVVPGPDRSYTISWTTPESSFDTDRAYFDIATRTFSPG